MLRAAWYEKNGPAAEVMQVGELLDLQPAAGEVRVRLHASAVNPSDVKARGSRPIRWPKLIPNSDGAGVIDAVGAGVNRRIGERVWVFNGQWDRAFGTSAQMIALPSAQAVPLPDHVTFEQGACLGIPVMTAHRALFADGPIRRKTLLVTGGAGVVGHYGLSKPYPMRRRRKRMRISRAGCKARSHCSPLRRALLWNRQSPHTTRWRAATRSGMSW